MKNLRKSKITEKIKEQKGAEMLQVVLISGVLLVLIITLFYPQMEGLFNNLMDTMTNWFNKTGSSIFTV